MDYHGIDMKGPILIEGQTTLPIWTAADERRLIYVTSVESFYFGTDSGWVRVIDAVFGKFVKTDGNSEPTTDNTYSVGTPVLRFANVYAVTFRGNLIGNVIGNVTGNVTGNLIGNVTGTATAAKYS